MFKWIARITIAKKVWDWYADRKAKKNSSNQSGGNIR